MRRENFPLRLRCVASKAIEVKSIRLFAFQERDRSFYFIPKPEEMKLSKESEVRSGLERATSLRGVQGPLYMGFDRRKIKFRVLNGVIENCDEMLLRKNKMYS